MYSSFAKNFDQTRGYVWPCVRRFVEEGKEGDSLLEAGCGNGKNLVYAKELGYNVKGFDICPEFVDICNKKGVVVELGDISCIKNIKNINIKKYDTILCIAVIHHLRSEEERVNVICSLYDQLKENGRMMITLWSYEKEYNGKTCAKGKDMNLGDNSIPWKARDGKHISDRYYYIYDFTGLNRMLEKVKEKIGQNVEIKWEEQNWILFFRKNNF